MAGERARATEAARKPCGGPAVRLFEVDVRPAPVAARLAPEAPPPRLQPLRFCAVGLSGYAVNLSAFHLVDRVLPYAVAFAVAFAVAATSNFLLHRAWTFRPARRRAPRQLARFLAVSGTALGLDLLLLAAFVHGAGLPRLVGAACAIALVTPFSFLANRDWSFAAPQPAR